jgi:pyruvate formate lyase activating enzyme
LAEVLDRETAPGHLWRREGERIRCLACGHRCLIAEGRRGICRVRFVRKGELRVPHGYVAGAACDPVEKKPFYHLYPGSDALTFGMLGCDFHCSYCQNWVTSQALRDPASLSSFQPATPRGIVQAALRLNARLVVSSYNEPLITSEWAVEVFKVAHVHGLACAFVSNGNATPEALEFLRPWICAYKIDLKTFDDSRYRKLGGTLGAVTEGIRLVHRLGLWTEVVTLLVPGFNDSEAELRDMAAFIASVSPDIPWHVTAFHPDYRMQEPPATPAGHLIRACEIGKEAGLKFVYAGNAHGRVGEWEQTRCPRCHTVLIHRVGFLVLDYRIDPSGRCPDCAEPIPGIWPAQGATSVPLATGMNDLYSRRPRAAGSLL